MYSICVRDHVMIAHSFQGAVFGPAQNLHGATFVVDLEMRRAKLDDDGIVVDIGRASEVLHAVLAELNYQNLDANPAFTGRNTTTEFLAKVIFDRFAEQILLGRLGPGGQQLTSMRVTLHESHVAWAAFDSVLPSPR